MEPDHEIATFRLLDLLGIDYNKTYPYIRSVSMYIAAHEWPLVNVIYFQDGQEVLDTFNVVPGDGGGIKLEPKFLFHGSPLRGLDVE